MTNQCTTIIHPLVVLPRPCWRCAVTLSPSPPQPRLAAAASVQSLAGPRAGLVTGHQHTRPAQPSLATPASTSGEVVPGARVWPGLVVVRSKAGRDWGR